MGYVMRSLNKLLAAIKERPDYDQVGMILCHNGVVRGTSRDGRPVSGLRMSIHHENLREIVRKYRKKPGIIEIQVELNEKQNLAVGDDLMFLIVAGDIRETVIDTLRQLLDDIKSKVTQKTEFFIE
jgi:molybdopterin synthase catalytic subunit